jgi:PAS domain S-box-containing protein
MKEELTDNSKQLNEVMDFLPAVVFEIDVQGNVLFSNDVTSSTIFGYSSEEILGKPFFEFIAPEDRSRCIETAKNVMNGKYLGDNEFTIIKKDGTRIQVFIQSVPVKNNFGELAGMRGFMVDITRRKRAEAELRESEQKYRSLINNIKLGVFRTSLEGKHRFLEVNKAMEDIHGYSRDELLSMDVDQLNVNLEDRENFKKEIRKSFGTICRETKIRKKDGSEILVSAASTPVRDAEGKILHIDAIIEDITERRKTEEKTRQLAAIVESTQDAIFGTTIDWIITSWNIGAEKIFGYQDTDVLGKKVSILVSPDHLYELDFILMKIHQKESLDDFESVAVRKDGQKISVILTICPILDADNKITGISCICRDISEHKRIEDVLRNSEKKYRTLVNNLKVGVFRNTPDSGGRILECNKALEGITGYSRDELLNIRVVDLYRDADKRKTEIDKIITSKKSSYEFNLRKKDGTIVYVSVNICTVTEENGKILYFDGIMEDITERKKAQELISESEKKYRSLVNNIKLGIIRSTFLKGGKVLESNKAFQEITGYSRDELLSINMSDLFTGSEEWLQLVEDVMSGGEALTRELLWVRKDLIKIMVSITLSPIKDHKGNIIYMDSIVEDITERKFAEEERKMADEKVRELYKIEKSQREELEEESNARGLFINALAHELRTPLTPILNSTEILRDIIFETQSENIQHRLVANVLESSQNLAHRLEELLDLGAASRGVFKLHMQPVHMRTLFEKIVTSYKPVFARHQQQFIAEIPDVIPEAVIDPERLTQVITNLLSNASKFSPEKSLITMVVKVEGRRLQVDVTDQGIGISLDDQEKLFKPYHQVEQDRQRYPGTGLGLAICKQIIQAHEGKIWITSDGGSGSTFSFRIPIKQFEN